MKYAVIMVLTALGLVACKSLYDRKTYVKTAAAGAIGSGDWKYAYAYTDAEAKLPEGIEYMIILKTQKPANACPDEMDTVKDAREVLIGIDGKPGEMVIGQRSRQYETPDDAFTFKKPQRSGSVAFLDPSKPAKSQYQFATSGKIKITKFSADAIEGMVVAKVSPDYFVNGKFRAKVCKWGQLN